MSNSRIGVYVDAENIGRNGGYAMRYEVLRRFAERFPGSEILRLNTYLAVDQERMRVDFEYRANINSYLQAVRDVGWKVVEKPVRWFGDPDGIRTSKANSDLDMAVDMMLQADRLDQILLVTGDGDFLPVVRALQNKGCRVEVLGFQNVSRDLQHEADSFYSGYLIPGLLQTNASRTPWGELGSRVRGTCLKWDLNRGYGFLRFLTRFSGPLWLGDTRQEESPYDSAFLHYSELPREFNHADLPSRSIILEFDLEPGDPEKGGFMAKRCQVTYRYDGKSLPETCRADQGQTSETLPEPTPAEIEN